MKKPMQDVNSSLGGVEPLDDGTDGARHLDSVIDGISPYRGCAMTEEDWVDSMTGKLVE